MNKSSAQLSPDLCRKALQRFWQEQLAIEETAEGLVMALPVSYPDGWQVIVHAEKLAPAQAVLTDRGRTLGWLFEEGVSLERPDSRAYALFEKRKSAYGLEQTGLELQKPVKLPLSGADVQLFADGLISVAYLCYRAEPAAPPCNAAAAGVQRFLEAHKIKAKRHHQLEGKIEKKIEVDFYVENGSASAIVAVKRTRRLIDSMEQWAWRWTDLRRKHPEIKRAMVYDPDQQQWDETSMAIGDAVCHVFCPYFDTDRLSSLLLRNQVCA